MIGGAHLYNGIKAGLTTDRFGRSLSALNLNEGCYQIPPGNYFPTGQFTITVWCKLRAFGLWSNIVSFFNGILFDAIFFGFQASSSNPELSIFNGNISIADAKCPSAIQLNQWTHLTISFDQSLNFKIYVNANLTANANWNQPLKNTTRVYNFIGRADNYPGDKDLNAVLDELKIFNRALTQQEIQFEMNNDIY